MDTPIGSISGTVDIDTGGADADLAALKRELSDVVRALALAQNAANSTGDASGNLAASVASLKARYDALQSAIVQVNAAAQDQHVGFSTLATTTRSVDASMEMTARQMKGVAFASLEVSRGLEDLSTGGFLGALNNIPQAFQGIGMAAGLSTTAIAGLTAGVGLAATGAYLLYTHYGDLEKLLIGSYTEVEAVRMERLEHSTHKTAKETEELNRWKRANADLDKLNSITSDADKHRAQEVEKTIGEVGPGKAQAAVARGLHADYQNERTRLADQMADIRERTARNGGAMSEADLKKYNELETQRVMQKAMHAAGPKAFGDKATELLLEATKPQGRKAFDKIRGMMKDRPQDFGGGLISGFQAASPEQQELDRKGKDEAVRQQEATKHREEKERVAEKEAREREAGIRKATREVQVDADRRADALDFQEKEKERAATQAAREFKQGEAAALKGVRGREKVIGQRAGQFGPAYARDIYGAMEGKADDASIRSKLEARLAKQTDIPAEILADVAAKMVADARRKFDAAVVRGVNEHSRKPLDRLVRPGGGGAGRGLAAPLVAPDGASADPAAVPLDRAGRNRLAAERRAAGIAGRNKLRANRRALVLAKSRERHGVEDADGEIPEPVVRPKVKPLPGIVAPVDKVAPLIATQAEADERRGRLAREAIDAFNLREVARKAAMMPARKVGPNGLPLPGPGMGGVERIRETLKADDKRKPDDAKAGETASNTGKMAEALAPNGPVVTLLEKLTRMQPTWS